ncbi:hypothetical protein [Pseudomonas sp. Marseille-Q5115]|uniref:hypothetical protein n=1 Tax=Pseudomonas sp. Marseille-Q5115 TaxID=2866593 RepID=UPI001CE43705|nr:hypothetical protein [Pseudomonas sp. Marseille-Q5115]
MFIKDPSRSFIATVATQALGNPGWWDCRDVQIVGEKVAYTAVPWLTVLDAPGAEPAKFRFDYYRDPDTGKWGYEVLSWDFLHGRGFASLGVKFGLSVNNYVGLYPASREVGGLWKLFGADGHGFDQVPALGPLSGMHLRSPRKRMLGAHGCVAVGDHWLSYVVDDSGVPMDLTLDVVLVGEEPIDDH